jgi:hypothetical protein
MRIHQWTHGLPARLELAADVIDDLANGVWVVADDHRERLFSIEAQIWRIAQTVRKADNPESVLPFLDRSLRAARSNVRLCQKLPVCDDEGLELLEGVRRELDQAVAELEVLPRVVDCQPQRRLAVGGRS